MIRLNRNKIYSIGKNPSTVTIKQIDKKSNNIIDSFEVYKCIRRKNKLFCFCLGAKLNLTFNNLINTIKCQKRLKEILQEEIK